MFKTLYKNCSILSFLWVILSTNFLQAQDQKPIAEKVYLHTDRSIYFLGEDLWYKAYNINASSNLLYDNSNVLYVELISSDSKIVAKNKTNLEIGLGNGDFQLKDSLGIKPGHYQLRAYTNWNRNFGDDFVFKKNIEIIDAFEPYPKNNKILEANKTQITENEAVITQITKPYEFKINFFPEGGSLLENVSSIVGFKAVDINGKPIAIKGEIYNSNDELVTTFASAHDGMGKLQILPMEGKKYFTKLKSLSGEELKMELPNVLKQGYLVSFRAIKGRNIVSISTNQATLAQNPNAVLTVICKAKGISYLETRQTLAEKSLSFELPQDKIPEGISQITLFDSANQPQSERLIYIEKEQDIEVQLSTDKASYQPNEKVTINVSSKSKADIAKSASFSLSVTDMNGQVEEKDFNSNISSYFLMESDIRGKVPHPGYYFDTNNPNRLEHLDNLLLTQGWRDFVWKTMPKVSDVISYKAEKGFTISGRVKQIFGEKAKANNKLSLTLSNKKGINFFDTTTDSIGVFKFENLMFSGKTNMQLNARNEKGKFAGEIVLDPIEQAPMAISFKKESINFTETTRITVENVFKKYTGLDVKPEGVLHEVAIVGKENRAQFHIKPISALQGFTYRRGADTDLYIDIFDLITKKIPDVTAFESSVRFLRFKEPPLFTLDGQIVLTKEISAISLSDVGDIWAFAEIGDAKWYGEEAPNGVIAIWTKSFTGNQSTKNTLSSNNKKIEGFYTARVFYSPTPEQAELDNMASVRNTLYWNPELRPDKTGNASATYYNTKVETKVKVALEGITAMGIPVTKKVYYTIKK